MSSVVTYSGFEQRSEGKEVIERYCASRLVAL